MSRGVNCQRLADSSLINNPTQQKRLQDAIEAAKNLLAQRPRSPEWKSMMDAIAGI